MLGCELPIKLWVPKPLRGRGPGDGNSRQHKSNTTEGILQPKCSAQTKHQTKINTQLMNFLRKKTEKPLFQCCYVPPITSRKSSAKSEVNMFHTSNSVMNNLCVWSVKKYHSFQKQATKEVPSKPVDILSEAAMRNAYYPCHNVQVLSNTRS